MAIINYSPWQDAANFGQGLGQSLTNLLISLPRLRQQQALDAAHAQAYQAQAGLYKEEAERAKAQTGLYGAQVGEISSSEAAKRNIGIALGQIPTTEALGGDIGPLISDTLREMPKLTHAERAGLAESLAQMLEMDKPRFRTALGLGSKMTETIPSQGSLYNVISGLPEFQAPQKLGYGESLVPAEGGPAMAVGQDRPLGAQNLGSVLGAFARTAAENAPPGKEVSALQNYLMKVSELMPNLGQRIVTAPTNAPPAGVARTYYNPLTGRRQATPP